MFNSQKIWLSGLDFNSLISIHSNFKNYLTENDKIIL